MFAAPEQFADVNKSNVDAALKFAKVTFDATERLLGLQLAVARDALSEGAKNAKVIAEVKVVQAFTALRGKLTEAVGRMDPSDVAALRAAGCDDGEILEVNQVCAYFNYSNRLLNGLCVTTEGDVIGYYADPSKERQE